MTWDEEEKKRTSRKAISIPDFSQRKTWQINYNVTKNMGLLSTKLGIPF